MRALLTGATSGIGEALVPLLLSKGYVLILSGRNEARLQQLSASVKSPYIVADLSEKEGRQKIIEVIEAQLPDLLINCAGFTYYGEMLSRSASDQLTMLEVNAVAPIELTLAAARALVAAQKEGVILNVSSMAGEHPAPGMGLYGPAKACLTHFSRTLNTELAPKGVHVLVNCPGMVATDFANRAAGKRITQKGAPLLSPHFVAQEIFKQIEQLKEKRVINWFYRLAALLVPAGIAKKLIWKNIQKRL
ncbi:MAG: NADP-dependent 3-hydroxy acid dehydrogenase YdfG [Chlamydiales bacterium]|nr:NADP-dependent 3-hydroxy acid dehydrogenase YdfG [Chlamydiales bacterium]